MTFELPWGYQIRQLTPPYYPQLGQSPYDEWSYCRGCDLWFRPKLPICPSCHNKTRIRLGKSKTMRTYPLPIPRSPAVFRLTNGFDRKPYNKWTALGYDEPGIFKCQTCSTDLAVGVNWLESVKTANGRICKTCRHMRDKHYYEVYKMKNAEKLRLARLERYLRERGPHKPKPEPYLAYVGRMIAMAAGINDARLRRNALHLAKTLNIPMSWERRVNPRRMQDPRHEMAPRSIPSECRDTQEHETRA